MLAPLAADRETVRLLNTLESNTNEGTWDTSASGLSKLRATGWPCEDRVMPSSPLAELLKLPAGNRAELAMALWESLTDAEREGEFELSDEDRTELDRRWAE